MSLLRYPAEFTANAATDYIEFCAVRPKFGDNFRKGGLKYNYHPTSVILNVPQKVVENHSQNWNNAKLGEVTPQAVSSILSAQAGGIGSMLAELGNQGMRVGEGLALDLAIKGMQRQGASGITQNSILSATGGIVYNPNLEILYEGPDFRTFNFQFVLFNKSGSDATQIYNIVDWFRDQSVPSLNNRSDFGGSGESAGSEVKRSAEQLKNQQDFADTSTKAGWSFSDKSRFLAQPPFILMTYKRGAKEHPFIRPLLPAALNAVNIDYTPTGNYTVINNFGEKQKATTVAANITLQMTERTNLTFEELQKFKKEGSTKYDRAPKG